MKNVIRATIISSVLLWGGFAQADTVSFFVDSENDCSGVYGSGFAECEIGAITIETVVQGNKEVMVKVVNIGISPIIVKYDTECTGFGSDDKCNEWGYKDPEINTDEFPGFTDSNLTLSALGTSDGGTGSWSYSPDADDPGIRFWVAKAGNGFNVFYDLDDGYSNACGDVSGNDCMQLANIVTAGTWTTPLNNQGSPRGLSHISFYDTDGGMKMSEPGTLALLGLGLLGMGLSRRRRVHK